MKVNGKEFDDTVPFGISVIAGTILFLYLTEWWCEIYTSMWWL